MFAVGAPPARNQSPPGLNGCVANRMRSALIAHRRDLYRYIFQAAMPNIRSMKRLIVSPAESMARYR